ncbi:LysR family transcriptional regulator [Corticibacter populi]|uniref:LysR family transcriptional regulator n=1 Tax=Corticibacter populi TaxID=1550736 RepID=A0A3M6QIY4_9BURK|nr:LysR family transcriptional regulator [Corticibacter populi]RMX03034.1 LysR family transcriptional regulator [Corticibacter populi]RZS33470.1 DNA-binding transcriptional LysR family regulator [Corticibacter populi]
MKVTFDELQTFLAVVDTGSLTAAAQQLGQTVSATSRLLARLEGKLQTTLLRRTTRRLDLSDEGCTFLQDARAIVAAVEQAEARMTQRRGQPSGPLRVDAATPFMLHVIAPLVQAYRARFPLVELALSSNEGFIDLLEQRTDVAVRIGALKDSTLRSRLLGRSRLRVLASPSYLARHGMPERPGQLDAHERLGFSQPESLNTWPLPGPGGLPLQVVPSMVSTNGETLRQLALAGAGIACLSDFMTWQDLAQGRLVQVLPQQTLVMQQPIHAVYYRNTAVSARIASFVDHLAGAIRAAPWGM